MSRQPLVSFRVSEQLRGRVQRAGEFSSAARALLILGLVAAGEPISAYRKEAQQALAGVSDPMLAEALGRLLYNPGQTSVSPKYDQPAAVTDNTPDNVSPSEDLLSDLLGDSFADVGIEV